MVPSSSQNSQISLTVVLPSFNESAAVGWVLLQLRDAIEELRSIQLVSEVQVLVVDDCSTDDTWQILKTFDWIELYRMDRRSGYGAALKAGFSRARGDWIAFLDMDATYDPADLGSLLRTAQIPGVDLVFGDRMAYGEGMPLIRNLGNRFFTALTRALFKRPVRDVCTGYRAFHRRLLPGFLQITQDSLDYSLAMTLMVIRERRMWMEVPIRYHRRSGLSKLNVVGDGLRFLGTILGDGLGARNRESVSEVLR